MRYLRNTMFPPPEIGPPATFVTSERDLRVPIEVAANQMRSHPGPPPPSDIDVEIFEFEGDMLGGYRGSPQASSEEDSGEEEEDGSAL